MATITVSAAGGNWNSTATWVGGVIPTSTDNVRADATSGNLTVNVNVSVQFVNFTDWIGLLTINSTNTLTLNLAASTSTFSAAGTYSFGGSGATQGRIVKGNTAMSFNMLGTTPIPHFQNIGAATLTALSNLYFINLFSTTSLVINGFITYISGSFDAGFSTNGGTTIYEMIGTGTLTALQVASGELRINTSGTITINSNGIGLGLGNASSVIFRHQAGTIVNPKFRNTMNTVPIVMDLISGTSWNCISLQTFNGTSQYSFLGTPQFSDFSLELEVSSSITPAIFLLSGSSISMDNLMLAISLNNSGGNFNRLGLDMAINTGTTITVNNSIDLNGGLDISSTQNPPLEIRSNTPGTQANLIVNTYNQYVSRTRFTDINCSGGNTLYGQTLTLSNTTNITQYTLPPTGGGGGGGSFTFVN